MLPIEKNVPIPARYPFGEMEVGDSFAIPLGVARNTVTVAAGRYDDKHNMKFTVRRMADNTLRCWRIA
jgi:hypothetical protein